MTALYGEVIRERFRHPTRQGELPLPDAAHEDVNPLCGDRIRMAVRLGDGEPPTIEAVRFQGDACAIAVASADVLAEMVEGLTVTEAARVERDALVAVLGAVIRPARLACVALPLAVLRGALGLARARR